MDNVLKFGSARKAVSEPVSADMGRVLKFEGARPTGKCFTVDGAHMKAWAMARIAERKAREAAGIPEASCSEPTAPALVKEECSEERPEVRPAVVRSGLWTPMELWEGQAASRDAFSRLSSEAQEGAVAEVVAEVTAEVMAGRMTAGRMTAARIVMERLSWKSCPMTGCEGEAVSGSMERVAGGKV